MLQKLDLSHAVMLHVVMANKQLNVLIDVAWTSNAHFIFECRPVESSTQQQLAHQLIFMSDESVCLVRDKQKVYKRRLCGQKVYKRSFGVCK
jgi:hypothetical protein